MVTFATQENIRQPLGKGFVPSVQKPEDHVMGIGIFTGPAWVALTDGHWTGFEPAPRLQHNAFGDTYWCVTFSCNSNHGFIHRKKYGTPLDKSERFLAIGSGTVRGQGNSKSTVAEWNRTNGFVAEADCPYLDSTSLDEAYAPLDPVLFPKGKANLDIYSFGYKFLKDGTPENLKVGLQFSPVQVDVQAYAYDANGYIINSGGNYIHEVDIYDYEEGKCWHIWDSENQQFIKLAWNYNFGSPLIHNVEKKNMFKLIKLNSSPSVYLQTPSGNLYAISDSDEVKGGDLLKTFSGTYANANITHVDTLDLSKVVGKIAATKDLFHSIF